MDSFQEIPRFQTPEEELSFLRNEVAKRQQELKERSLEIEKDQVVKDIIKEYQSIETEKVLPSGRITREEDAEGIVLRLRPETHDKQIEEMLGILMESGLKNALNILEELGSPHLEDDFHRFLIQYLGSAHQVPGLLEGPYFKALNMKLYEVSLPEESGEEKKGFTDFIQAMEQFYAGMLSVGNARENFDRNYYTIEIANPNESEEIAVYVAIPDDKVDLFEKQVLAFYNNARIREVTDDYNVFDLEGEAHAAFARLGEYEVFPLKTYDTFDHDPMNPILNIFSKLKKKGEGAAIQITIVPAGDRFVKKYNSVLKNVRDGMKVKKAMDLAGAFHRQMLEATKSLVFGGKGSDEKPPNADENAIGNITEKMKSTIVSVGIRIVAGAGDKMRAKNMIREIESAFNQFTHTTGNQIVFEDVSENKLNQFLRKFSYRLPDENEEIPLNLKELSTIFHFPVGVASTPQLKQAQASSAPAPMEMSEEGILLGVNSYRGRETKVVMDREDRVRHFYVIGQTGTGKTTIMKNMIAQDILNGDGCCYIDPHGTDIQDILSYIPKERIDDVIYFDPAYTARPMGLNMLEYDPAYPEQKTFVVNEMMNIFNKLFDMKAGGGAMFEQYFRNSAFLIMEDPESGSTLLEITRVLSDKKFRDAKLARCKNPIIKQFWETAEQTTGDQSLANFVPYISSKFDNFISNDIMRPVVLQQNSVFNFRKIMDEKKILLVNLSKGRLGDINANLIGLVIVNKIQMAALSRVDMYGKKMNDFYLYIDEFQNVTTDSIASILSEARKYRLSLNVAHQYIAQLEEGIRDAVFGNVGSMAIFRVSPEDAEYLENKVKPTFTASDIIKIENYNAYMSMLVKGAPVKPFNIKTLPPPEGNKLITDKIKELSYLKYGKPREEVEEEIMSRYRQ